MKLRPIILALFFCFFFSISLAQAPDVLWTKLIGGSGVDLHRASLITNDAGYIVAGRSSSNISGDKSQNSYANSSDYWVVKLDQDRNIQWQTTLGGNQYESLSSVLQTSDGYLVVGSSDSDISGNKTEVSRGSTDFWIVKLSQQGDIQWQKAYGGSDIDFLEDAISTDDGGYLLAGFSRSSISGDKTENSRGVQDGWLIKIDNLGNIQWQKTIGGSAGDFFTSVLQTSDGGYIVGGYSASPISGEKTENSYGLNDYWVLKIDALGNIIWQKTIGGSLSDSLTGITITANNTYLICGNSNSSTSGLKDEDSRGGTDIWLLELDSFGNINWQKTIGGNDDDNTAIKPIIVMPDFSIVLCSGSRSDISGDKTEPLFGISDIWLVKLNSSGNILWQKTIGGTAYDGANYIGLTPDNRLFLGAVTESSANGNIPQSNGQSDYLILELKAEDLSISQSELNKLIVYPNPTIENINIQFPAAFSGTVSIYNMLGKRLLHKIIQNDTIYELKLPETTGIYLLKLTGKNHDTITYKIIKK